MTLAWADTPHRHRHRFEAGLGGAQFVKVATDADAADDLRREAEVLRLLERRLPAASLRAPRLVGWSEGEGALRLEAIAGEDLGRRTRDAGLLDVAASAELGAALGELHREGRDAAGELGTPGSGPVGVHRPTPGDMSGFSGGALELLIALQRSAPLCAHLNRLCVPLEPQTLIHGDVRLENVLVGGSSGLRLVDWEFAGAGEGAWDVALAMGSALGAWLSSIPQIPAVPPERLLGEAALPLAGVRPGLAALWLAYADATRGATSLRRCLDLTAVRLVQLAVEAAGESEDLRAAYIAHLQLAHNLLGRPDELCDGLLGLPLTNG